MNNLKQKALEIWVSQQNIDQLDVAIKHPGFFLGVYEYMHYTGDRSFVVGYGKTEDELREDISKKYNSLYKCQKYPPLKFEIFKIDSEDLNQAVESRMQKLQHTVDVSREYCVIFRYDSEICGIGVSFEKALQMAESKFPDVAFPKTVDEYMNYESANVGDLCVVPDVCWQSYNRIASGKIQDYKVRRSTASDNCYPWDDLCVDNIN